jgi:predicted DNA-binding transcriptional regulator AlpA
MVRRKKVKLHKGRRDEQVRVRPTSAKATTADVMRSSPLKLIRPGRLAKLLDCDPSTIWRWEDDGTLPPPIVIAGVKGWPEHELLEWMKARRSTGQREQAK